MKNVKGISLIALIITIIVIIILAAIVITMSLSTPDSANFAKYCSEVSGLQEAVTVKYAEEYAKDSIAGNSPVQATIYARVAGQAEMPAANYVAFDSDALVTVPSISNAQGTALVFYVTNLGKVFNFPVYTYDSKAYVNATTSAATVADIAAAYGLVD